MNTRMPDSEGEVPVVCDVCHTRWYVPSRQIGRDAACPECDARNRVRPPIQLAPRTTTQYTGDEYRIADDASPAPTPNSELVKIVCSICYTLMHARLEHVGKRVRCPDCGTINGVPRPPKKREFRPPDASEITVESAPPPLVDVKRKEIADRLMANASQEIQERDRERPRPPKDPLRNGIYSFPFYANVVPLWIGATIALLVDFALLLLLIDVIRNGGLASIVAAFIAPIVAIVTFSILGIIAPHLLTIIEFTADGHDKIPYWPSQDLLSRLRALLFAANALAMSTMPGMLLVWLLRPIGVPLQFGLISTVLLLPLVTLSMAENDSVFAPYSHFVFSSLRRHGKEWSRFYAQIVLLLLTIVAIDFAIWFVMTEIGARAAAANVVRDNVSHVFMIASLCLYAVVYCRLVGRMAWILGQEDVKSAEAAADNNNDGPRDASNHIVTSHAADHH